MIVVKCPLRISLVGGSTDLEEFIQTYDKGSVISFPSTLSVYVTLHKNHRNKIIVNYSSKEEVNNVESIKNDIVRVVMQYFEDELERKNKFVTITFNSDIISHGSGLATSSAYMIATIKAFASYLQIDLSDFEICKLAIELERKFNPLTGYQDTYGCGISGFKRIVFEKNKRPKFRYFETKFLHDNFDMCLLYTGVTRNSTEVLQSIDVAKSFPLLSLVDQMDDAIDSDDVETFLRIFNQGWEIKKQSSSLIFDTETFTKYNKLFEDKDVVKGVKLCGAGAGGYFLVLLAKDEYGDDWGYQQFLGICAIHNVDPDNIIRIQVSNTGVTEFHT